MGNSKLDILERAIKREKLARKAAEKILESKSAELYNLTQELQDSNLKLESLLKQKSSELKGVFENIVDSYVVIDLSGNVLKMNEAAVAMLGFESINDQVNLMSLVPVSQLENVELGMTSLVKDGSLSNFELWIVTNKDQSKLVSINASLILTDDGNPIAAQGIVRDITLEREKNELISEQKKQLEIIVDHSPLGIVLTQEGQIIKASTGASKIFGYPENELKKFAVRDITHPEDQFISKDLVVKMDKGDLDYFSINKRYFKKDGSILWAKTTVNAVRNSQGEVKYQVALVEDITKERESQLMVEVINNVAKSILGKVNYYEIAWEIVNVIADYLKTDDCVIYLVDYDTNKLEQVAAFGQKIEGHEVINKIDIPLGKGIVGSVAVSGTAEIIDDVSKDLRYIADDDVRSSEITVPIISRGKVLGIIDSEHREIGYYNSTHLETLTNVARIVSMQFEKAISLAQKEKAEKQSRELLKRVEESNVELQEYAHVVSHDLKSPLRSLYALTHWLKEDNVDKLDENSLKNIALMQSTLGNMEKLITDVLEYSSVGSDKSLAVKVDLNRLLKELIKNLQIPSNFQISIKRQLPVINGDPTRFKQLFQNLIINAIKYNDKKLGIVEIDVVEKKSHYEFKVADNGLGIDEKYHKKVFEVFQGLSSSKDSTGVGLSIVKKIVELYKGKIWLESEVGVGTTFYFTLKK